MSEIGWSQLCKWIAFCCSCFWSPFLEVSFHIDHIFWLLIISFTFYIHSCYTKLCERLICYLSDITCVSNQIPCFKTIAKTVLGCFLLVSFLMVGCFYLDVVRFCWLVVLLEQGLIYQRLIFTSFYSLPRDSWFWRVILLSPAWGDPPGNITLDQYHGDDDDQDSNHDDHHDDQYHAGGTAINPGKFFRKIHPCVYRWNLDNFTQTWILNQSNDVSPTTQKF